MTSWILKTSLIPIKSSEPLKIRPISPKIATDEKQARSKRRLPIAGVASILAVLVLVSLFAFLPERTIRLNSTAPEDASTSNPSTNQNETTQQVVSPFKDLVLERARADAQETLRAFGAFQDEVESSQLGLALYQSRYNQIIDEANAADILFAKREFTEALTAYADAVQQIGDYVKLCHTEYSDALLRGNQALADRKTDLAVEKFTLARRLKPKEVAPRVGLDRTSKLPKINELLRESERAKLRGDLAEAERLLGEAHDLDSLTPGLQDRLVQIQDIRSDEAFKALVSSGFKALNEGKLPLARQIFESAALQEPENASVKTGLAEVLQTETLSEIERLQELGGQLEEAGDLPNALAAYNSALELDSNLEFAREGKIRLQRIQKTTADMHTILADPYTLSSDVNFKFAEQTLELAREFSGYSDAFDTNVDDLAQLLVWAAKPLQVVLVSDNTMEIRLAGVGDLGLFLRKELSLRPGRYLLHGSADGCRDVRQTIVVEADMDPVSVQCLEPM